MNRKSISLIALLAAVIALMGGCTKSNPAVFSWDYQGRHYVADSSSVSSTSDNVVVAYSGLTAVVIDGGGKLGTGTYTLHGYNQSNLPFMAYAVINAFTYSQSGTVNITFNDNTKISGNFSVTYTDGTTMTGSFTDIPYK
jgi:hypothetical protein